MKGKLMFRIIFLVLTIGAFTTIFIFSNQNGTKSKSVSEKFMRGIVDIFPKTAKLNNEEKEKIVLKSQPFIRKIAHFTIYMITGFLIMSFLSTYNLKFSKRLFITIILGIIYAICDEIHQGFVGGRTPRAFDVFVDGLGILTGSSIIVIVQYFKMIVCKNR